MKQRPLGIVTLLILAILIAFVIVWPKLHPTQSQQLQSASQAPTVGKVSVGARAPEFQAATTTGLFDLNAATKPIFLEVFATWCPHCQRETVVLNQLYAAYHSKIDFVAVSGSDTGMDESSPASQLDVLNFAQRFKVKYPIAYDGTLGVAGLYLQGGFPTLVIIDKQKIIRYLTDGETPYSTLAAKLNAVLRE